MDIDEALLAEGRKAAKAAGVEHLVSFRREDLMAVAPGFLAGNADEPPCPTPTSTAPENTGRCVGLDIDEALLAEGRKAAKAAGVEHLVSFRREDLMAVAPGFLAGNADEPPASAVYMSACCGA